MVLFATYEGRASGVQTKPSGTHLKDKHIVYWRLGDLAPSAAADWQKIVCRIVGEQGAEPQPGAVEARWEFSPPPPASEGEGGIEGGRVVSVSRLEEAKGKDREVEVEPSDDDPFADVVAEPVPVVDLAPRWVDVPGARRLVSGKYQAL